MKKELVATGFALFCFTLPEKAIAAKFDALYVFGDSLSDTGNTFTATQGQIPVPRVNNSNLPAYFPGRFSNGPIWVDYFGSQTGLIPTPFVALQTIPNTIPKDGVNFALGGAQTGIVSSFPGFQDNIPGVLGQVALLRQNLPVDSNGLYSIFGGGNDYFAGNTNVNQVIQNLTNSIGSLAQGGATNFLVFNLPDLGESPFGKILGFPSQLNQLTQEHNRQLALAISSLRTSNPDLNIYSVDINTLFNTIRATPAKFGFKDVTTPCVTGNFQQVTNICDNPDDFLFFDNVHPSSRAQNLIAQAALAAINGKTIPEPSAALGMLALGALGAAKVRKRKVTSRNRVVEAEPSREPVH
ncbi:SGNH/GDSL hydrolase family protein [Scytonema hofmannii FACHB-248]|uniref:SGNH/GDSL hydrolase family protein n=1 Tax=Scytonema hofmannii FACHB-248 TaxID=1842502 RepID=A0ABR8GXK0_9CYAN|nr:MULTISPECIES: SGNH/GDSL hydrolase family protein [Nostocales]MBD2607902.1 SGNH/GDSL hydrolase family protein [Scytonema hofmannii FACHB-248]